MGQIRLPLARTRTHIIYNERGATGHAVKPWERKADTHRPDAPTHARHLAQPLLPTKARRKFGRQNCPAPETDCPAAKSANIFQGQNLRKRNRDSWKQKTPNWKNIFFQLEKKFSLTGEFFDTKYAPETTHAPLFRIVKYFLKKTGWARFRKREKYGIPRKVTQGIAAQNLFNFTSTTDSSMYHAMMAAKAL